MDVSIFPAWVDYYVQLDSGAKSYFGLILMFHLHNNPVMRVSCWILEDDARERKALLLKYLPSEFNGAPPAAQKDEQQTAKQLSLMDRHVYRTMLDTWRTDYNDGKVALCSPAYRKASNMWNKVWMMHKNVTLVQYSASGDMTASAAVVAKVRLVHVPCTHPAHAYMPCPPRHDLLVTRLTHPPTHPLPHPLTHPLTQSLSHSVTHPLTHPPTHSPTHSLSHSVTHSLSHSVTRTHSHSPTMFSYCSPRAHRAGGQEERP